MGVDWTVVRRRVGALRSDGGGCTGGAVRSRRTARNGSSVTVRCHAEVFVWESIKIVLTVAMLVAAPWLVGGLNWLALVAGVIAALKTYWIALVVRPRLLNRI